MKNLCLVSVSLVIILLSSCDSYMSNFSPGTLGSVADTQVDCPVMEIQRQVDILLERNPYKIQASDTVTANSWHERGYDFLTFRCVNIKKRLYMITIDHENSTESIISIRAYYNRNEKKWVGAEKFNSKENYHAEKSMESFSVLFYCE
jgi:hypothetical protein